jgi:hypothetical protein
MMGAVLDRPCRVAGAASVDAKRTTVAAPRLFGTRTAFATFMAERGARFRRAGMIRER